MTPERWREIKKVLGDALERAPEERSAYIAQVCAEPDLRREVESLIAAHDQAHTIFLTPPGAEQKEPAVGERLGSYEILARIGAGGMGVVYRAADTKLRRAVALKVLPPEMARDPERLARFQREARSVAALNHPHIVTLHSVEEVDGIHFLTMELVEGQPLDRLIPEGGLPVDRILEVASAIAEALAAAHERGIVHRDLKPANVMLTDEGRVKVLDFGLAKEIHAPNPGDATLTLAGSTGAGIVMGTPAYMSPEQIAGRALDHRTDIFSFGAMLYEMTTGQRPFQGSLRRNWPPRFCATPRSRSASCGPECQRGWSV